MLNYTKTCRMCAVYTVRHEFAYLFGAPIYVIILKTAGFLNVLISIAEFEYTYTLAPFVKSANVYVTSAI